MILQKTFFADNHRIDSKGRKNLNTNNFENFVFLRIFCIFLYLFVFICIFLYCYFFVLSEKIGRHEYKKIQKKHAFSPFVFNNLWSHYFMWNLLNVMRVRMLYNYNLDKSHIEEKLKKNPKISVVSTVDAPSRRSRGQAFIIILLTTRPIFKVVL